MILPYTERHTLRSLLLIAWAVGVVAIVLTRLPLIQNLLPATPAWMADLLLVGILPLPLGLTALLLWQFSSRLTDTLTQTRNANAALRQSQVELESRVTARTHDLRTALDEVARAPPSRPGCWRPTSSSARSSARSASRCCRWARACW